MPAPINSSSFFQQPYHRPTNQNYQENQSNQFERARNIVPRTSSQSTQSLVEVEGDSSTAQWLVFYKNQNISVKEMDGKIITEVVISLELLTTERNAGEPRFKFVGLTQQQQDLIRNQTALIYERKIKAIQEAEQLQRKKLEKQQHEEEEKRRAEEEKKRKQMEEKQKSETQNQIEQPNSASQNSGLNMQDSQTNPAKASNETQPVHSNPFARSSSHQSTGYSTPTNMNIFGGTTGSSQNTSSSNVFSRNSSGENQQNAMNYFMAPQRAEQPSLLEGINSSLGNNQGRNNQQAGGTGGQRRNSYARINKQKDRVGRRN